MNEAGADQSARDVVRLDNDTLAFRFTATLTNRNGSRFERLTSPQRLELWLRANDLMTPPQPRQKTTSAARRIYVRPFTASEPPCARTAVPHAPMSGSSTPHPSSVMPPRFREWPGPLEISRRQSDRDALSIVAADAIAVLGGADRDRVKACQGDGCTGLYFDTSRGNNRRWCSMNICGNKARNPR